MTAAVVGLSGDRAAAKLTVLANDSPHGVVSWEVMNYDVEEPTDTDTTLTLHIVRKQGSEGHIRVSYMWVTYSFHGVFVFWVRNLFTQSV